MESFARAAIFLSSVTLLLVAAAAHTQQEEEDVPQFPARVELVTVDVVVTDSHGLPVTGLGRGDFALDEDGVPQTLTTFEAILLPEEPSTAPTRRTVVSTNVRTEEVAAPGRWFGLVVDDLHLGLREAVHARTAAAAFLETELRAGDVVTLATTSGNVWWSTRMEAGREELLSLLEHVEARAPAALGPDWMSPYEAQRVWIHRDRAVADYVERRFSSTTTSTVRSSSLARAGRGSAPASRSDAATDRCSVEGARWPSLRHPMGDSHGPRRST